MIVTTLSRIHHCIPNKAYIVSSILFALLHTTTAQAAHQHLEKWYQEKWCSEAGGKMEYVLPDKTRADCLTKEYAVEFDFGSKWAEAIGQSLYYSLQTGRKAGVVLILEQPKDYKYWLRLNTTISHHNLPITTWVVRP